MEKFDLNRIAAFLEGLEETIIYKLIERAQFKQNLIIYEKGKSGFEDAEPDESLFDIRLRLCEYTDSLFGRYLVPEERPFTKNLPAPKRKVTIDKEGIYLDDFDKINMTDKIKKTYMELIPKMCEEGDDGQYGSSVEHDIYVLQAMSRRIHYAAIYVAESKYRSNPELYKKLIKENDKDKLMEALTRKEVEENILKRVMDKLVHIQMRINEKVRKKVRPEIIYDLYKDYIIPITKEGEILYFLNRNEVIK